MFVAVPVSFVDTRPTQHGKEFTDVTLRCDVKGGIKPTITWIVVGGNLLGESQKTDNYFHASLTFHVEMLPFQTEHIFSS